MFRIRRETSVDYPGIHQVHTLAFPTDGEATLVEALRVSSRLVVSLVATEGGLIAGHAALSPVTVAQINSGLGLGPVAVLPKYQRRGIGKQLVEESLAEADRAGFGFVVVLGAPEYYSRFGFRPASDFGIIDEFNGGRAFQAIELRAGSIPRGAGLVKYAAEFAVVT